jgi:triosephosphate isomerase (TIM)
MQPPVGCLRNARELLSVEDVDGALVGGASLNSTEFMAIAGIYR